MNGKDRRKVSDMDGQVKALIEAMDRADRPKVKNMRKLFRTVTRNTNPADAEAVQLTLGRDHEWRKRQVEVMKALSKIVRLMIMADSTPCSMFLKFSDMADMMISCNVFDVVNLLLRIQVPVAVAQEDATSNDFGDSWESVHFHSLELTSSILASSYMCDLGEQIRPFIDQIADNKNFVDILVQFAMDTRRPMMTCHALYILCQCTAKEITLSKKINKKKELFIVLSDYVMKNTAVKLVNDWYKGGIQQYEFDMMADRIEGMLPVVYEEQIRILPAQELTRDELRHTSMSYAYCLITLSLRLMGIMSMTDESIRTMVAKDLSLLKPCVRWLDIPVNNKFASAALRESLLIMTGLCMNEALCHHLVSTHNLIDILERGVYFSSYEHIADYFNVATKIAGHPGMLRYKIGKVENLARSAAIHMYSHNHDIQRYVLVYLTYTVETEGVQHMLKYFGPHHIHYYPTYYFDEEKKHNIRVTDLLKGYQHYAKGAYDNAMAQFQQRMKENKGMDERRAEQLKEQGNAAYQARKYSEAINKYTLALTICPPLKKRGHKIEWYDLPVTLYTNRAQCYLNLNQHEKAVRDCDKAVARFVGEASAENTRGTVKMNGLLRKALYRRSKALFTLGDLHRSLVDITQCVNGARQEDLFLSHKDKLMIAVRDKYGQEPIPTCDMCGGGIGKKLKRCGNCTGLYCSRDCQLKAWDRFHKVNCQEFVRTTPLEETD